MVQRRSITGHPAFVPFVAAWFAALFGLAVAVLPGATLTRVLGGSVLGALAPAGVPLRIAACGLAALVGAALGLLVARGATRWAGRDPRPLFRAGDEAPDETAPEKPSVRRRPLSVREEIRDDPALAYDWDEEPDAETPGDARDRPDPPPGSAARDDGFMILTPQPIHPPRPAPDLESLLDQFDQAIAAYGIDEAPPPEPLPAPDPVHRFVARQTGTAAASPLGGLVPDHQADLRAALDKLAAAMRDKSA